MSPELEHLVKLQEIESRAAEAERRLEETEATLAGLTAEVEATRTELERAAAAQTEANEQAREAAEAREAELAELGMRVAWQAVHGSTPISSIASLSDLSP